MNVALRWACLVMVLAGCGRPADTTPPPKTPPAQTPAPATSREILVDLARWDAATTADRRAAAEDVARRVPDFALLRLETFSCGGQTHEVAIYRHAKTEMEFVLVPAGRFLMGSPASEAHRNVNEVQHKVTLTKPFLIARTECTQEAYVRVTGENPSIENRSPACPVDSTSWLDAKAFCDKAGIALPTEAQWEYACRAGTSTPWCFGADESQLSEFGWLFQNSGASQLPATEAWDGAKVFGEWKCETHAVGGKHANALGLSDMHGNVFEWCEDVYVDGYEGAPTDGGAMVTGCKTLAYYAVSRSTQGDVYEWGPVRVARGGNCCYAAGDARSACRLADNPGRQFPRWGFRPAKTVPMD